jgi:hypothetical protein
VLFASAALISVGCGGRVDGSDHAVPLVPSSSPPPVPPTVRLQFHDEASQSELLTGTLYTAEWILADAVKVQEPVVPVRWPEAVPVNASSVSAVSLQSQAPPDWVSVSLFDIVHPTTAEPLQRPLAEWACHRFAPPYVGIAELRT